MSDRDETARAEAEQRTAATPDHSCGIDWSRNSYRAGFEDGAAWQRDDTARPDLILGVTEEEWNERLPRAMSEVTVGDLLALGDLTVSHVGQRVTIASVGATITGTLRGLTVDTDWIEDCPISTDPGNVEPTPGRQTMTVSVGEWTAANLPLTTPVIREDA